MLVAAGVTMLDGESCEIKGVGFAGAKGFGGGFGRGTLGAWGEPAVKLFVQEAIDEAMKLESALARLRTEHKIVVLHYAPIRATVENEPPEIFPYLGCSRLEEPLLRYPATAVVHGHAHNGTFERKTQTGVPVYNVSAPPGRCSTERHYGSSGRTAKSPQVDDPGRVEHGRPRPGGRIQALLSAGRIDLTRPWLAPLLLVDMDRSVQQNDHDCLRRATGATPAMIGARWSPGASRRRPLDKSRLELETPTAARSASARRPVPARVEGREAGAAGRRRPSSTVVPTSEHADRCARRAPLRWPDAAVEAVEQFIEEIPPIRPIVTRLVTYRGCCPTGGATAATPPAGPRRPPVRPRPARLPSTPWPPR